MPSPKPFDYEAYIEQHASPAKRDYLLEELRKAKGRAPETFDLQLRSRVEARYRRLLNAIFKATEQATAGLTDPAEIIRTLNTIANSPQFARMCEAAARSSITMLAAGERKSWQAAASASSMGKAIYKALNNELTNSAVGQAVEQMVQENARLIKTVPQNMAAKLSEIAKQRYAEGLRPEEITKEVLQKQPSLREFEARRIARTESSKAATALKQARAEAAGFGFYIWRTAGTATGCANRIRSWKASSAAGAIRPTPRSWQGRKETTGHITPDVFSTAGVSPGR